MIAATPHSRKSHDMLDEVELLRQQLAELEAEDHQREEEGHSDWREVVDTSNDAFISIEMSGEVLEWNRNAENLFGWSRQEVVGKKLDEMIFVQKDHTISQLLTVENAGKRLEVQAVRKDGTQIPTEVSISPMRMGASFVINAFIHDITTRRELQLQLAHSQKLESIGQLSAGIAHEINTPTQYVGDNTRFVRDGLEDLLQILRSYEKLAGAAKRGVGVDIACAEVERLSHELELDYLVKEIGDATDQSLEGIDRVTTIVRAMKEFSHPGKAAKTPTDLNSAIGNTITVATNEWKYVASVETDFDSKLPLVPCLLGDFNQVILNLIVNAAQAIGEKLGRNSGDKGVITVATRAEEDHAVITVADSGAGIPADVLGRIFDPFFTTKEVGVGSGQGLAIAHAVIVDKHQGTIRAENTPEGGAMFTLRLPLKDTAGSKREETLT